VAQADGPSIVRWRERGISGNCVDRAALGSRWDIGRIESFSDGVFAFAITLLVLDIDVSESAFSHLWLGIADQWPSYLGYATSFLTVGGSGSCTTASSDACRAQTAWSCGSICCC
jgi:Endosomal/lysosomal potassium channel TMEM175